MIHNPQKLVHMQRRALAAESDLCQKDRIITIQQLTLVLGRHARKGAVPLFFLTHRPHPTANFITSVPRQRWVPNRGKQTAAPLSSERGTGRERSFYIEKLIVHTDFPSRTSRACSLPKQKTQRLCVSSRWVPIFPHTILNALLLLAIW